MDIRGVSAGRMDPGLAGVTQGAPVAKGPEALAGTLAQIGADAVAGFLTELSASEITSLLTILDPALPPQRATQLDHLLREAVSATGDRDVSGALGKLATLVSLDPRRAESLASEPALAPIRKEVMALLARFTAAARLDAEARLLEATQRSQAPNASDRPIENVRPSMLLRLATRLIEAGGYANCIQSAGFSQMVIDQQRWAPAAVAPPLSRSEDASLRPRLEGARIRIGRITPRIRREVVVARIANLWRRAPLLLLLLGWLIVGLGAGAVAVLFREDLPVSASGLFFDMWAIGFLALVGFGFYMRVRNR